ncbi:DoxX family protein [Chryseobacterium indologenes]|uniref:DoxX family protein n=1 Tax=Chryseobacterium indologenes TaxID=253 RepID=A0A0N0IYI3_CHRID|nr:hypothetical protein [Chryseobacterium indologenes]KPE53122.1 DoxX family protein [Chryseobacterium indologenes]
MKKYFFLRCGLSVILLMHSAVSIFSGDVNNFGLLFLDTIGFSPFGLYLAWMIKLVHLASVALIWIDSFIRPVAICNILIFIFGIYYVHWQNGWFVVGGGTNGIEFNVLLICSFLQLMFSEYPAQKKSRRS